MQRRAGLGGKTRALGHGTCEKLASGESDVLGPWNPLSPLRVNTVFQGRAGKVEGSRKLRLSGVDCWEGLLYPDPSRSI